MKKFLLIITLSCLALSAYSQDTSEVFDYGTCENNIYTNTYFKLKVIIPPNWAIQSKGYTDSLLSKEINKITHKNPSLKPLFKAKDIKDATLLFASQYKKGAALEFNSGIYLMAENIMKFPKIKNGEDYLIQVKKVFFLTKPDYKLGKITKEKINGTFFYKSSLSTTTNNIKVKQTYYSTLIKGFSLSIISTYNTNKQKKVLLGIISSLEISE